MLTPQEIHWLIKHYEESIDQMPNREEKASATEVMLTLKHVLYSRGFDPIVAQLIDKIILRSRAGMEEYGTTLDENGLPPAEWLTHLQEELLDASLYIEKIKSIKP